MTQDSKWQQLKQLFSQALELEGAEQETWLKEACGDDRELLHELRSLLEARQQSGPVDQPLGELMASVFPPFGEPEKKAQQIGPYRIVEPLGQGGMGVVYLAERADGEFEQQVALKFLHFWLSGAGMVRRFRTERQILASLQHPHIARLLDGGVAEPAPGQPEGTPWFAMEYVRGVPITAYADEHRLSVDRRLALFLKVCRAVQYAHQRLIIHRDLKPSNILVNEGEEPRLLDFGLARFLEEEPAGEEAVTRSSRHWMTLAYASPEQVKGESLTTASDTYQLGLILYELLTGQRPYSVKGRSPSEAERIICETEPVRPSTAILPSSSGNEAGDEGKLHKRLKGDLDTIILKALHKDPEHRYASAEAMVNDLERHMNGLPIRARPDTLAYRAKKFVLRHRWGVAAVVSFAILLAGYALTVTMQSERIQAEAERATIALAETEQALARSEALHEFLLDLFRAAQPDRPRDQLPTTEALLELGAHRALNDPFTPPAERLGMLLTIGSVYLEQNRIEQARPLVDTAVVLARVHRAERPEDLARALVRRAALGWQGENKLAEAEAILKEAESIAVESDAFWNTFADARIDRGWVEYLKGNREEVLRLLEPLYRQMQHRDNVRPGMRYRMVNNLASTYHRLGNLEAAAELHTEANKLAARAYGSESLTYAIHLANSANVERELGRYEVSDERNRQALTLYDQIYGETPMVFRAVARRNRVRTLLAMGRFDVGWTELAASTDEFARATGAAPEHDSARFFYEGEMLVQMHQWEEAERVLTRALRLYDAQPESPVRSMINIEAWLAWALCRQHKSEAAETMLNSLNVRLQGDLPSDNRERAQIHTTRACYYFLSGSLDPALYEIDLALAAVTHPGRVVDRSDRMILRARILAAMDRRPEAEFELDQAEKLYRDAGLTEHPLFSGIDAVRQELTAGVSVLER